MITYNVVKLGGEIVASVTSHNTEAAHILAWAINERASDYTQLVSIVEVVNA